MRQIKFRAWDGKRMLFRILTDRNWYNSVDNKAKLVCVAMPEDRGRFKIMQFTGLKDKNGKEIYEGDVVKGNDDCHKVKGGVTFGFGMFWIEGRVWYKCLKKKGNSISLGGHEYNENNVEVIGNIYENPELLK